MKQCVVVGDINRCERTDQKRRKLVDVSAQTKSGAETDFCICSPRKVLVVLLVRENGLQISTQSYLAQIFHKKTMRVHALRPRPTQHQPNASQCQPIQTTR